MYDIVRYDFLSLQVTSYRIVLSQGMQHLYLVGLYAGEVGEYAGDVGEYAGLCGAQSSAKVEGGREEGREEGD